MRSEAVDPRDVSFEVEQPVYRVYFWEHTGTGYTFPQRRGRELGPAQAYASRASDEHRLHEAEDVEQVLAWAQAHAAGRSFVVYVEVEEHAPTGRQRGLVRLHGRDPDDVNSRCASAGAATARSAAAGSDGDPTPS
ncbi:hypothetical protein [Kineococcus arenarius]|uniref:hypothetical protein n=1 Tax=Kineococcus sp. SYSU DK007 TaxID=3383128 RepID=UPI003D7E662F